MRIALYLIVCVLLLAVTGCDLKFGNDVELSGAAFKGAKLKEVSSLTGIRFPPGSEGLEYFYLGSGIDDALAAKIRIPDEGVAEFKKNTVFELGRDSEPSLQIGKSKRWWKLDGLSERLDRAQELPQARFLELTCGREGGTFVVFISWITT